MATPAPVAPPPTTIMSQTPGCARRRRYISDLVMIQLTGRKPDSATAKFPPDGAPPGRQFSRSCSVRRGFSWAEGAAVVRTCGAGHLAQMPPGFPTNGNSAEVVGQVGGGTLWVARRIPS